MPQAATARAVLSGSSGSSGGGAREVLTAQKRQPRVQVSPMSMMVAVAAWPSPPPQHSPMLGQRASSQTVDSLSSRSLDLMAVYLSPPGMARFSQSGLRVFSCAAVQGVAGGRAGGRG
jgi:hypothetical protein